VLSHCLSWSKFVNTHLDHSRHLGIRFKFKLFLDAMYCIIIIVIIIIVVIIIIIISRCHVILC